jgi:uncharacterized membrane protein
MAPFLQQWLVLATACTVGLAAGLLASLRQPASTALTTSSASTRRMVLLHGLVAFLFNAVILAAAANITAGLVR